MNNEPRVTITERFTRTSWHRKIGDGPWEEMDCSTYGGKPPVVFLRDDIDWVETTTELDDLTPPK